LDKMWSKVQRSRSNPYINVVELRSGSEEQKRVSVCLVRIVSLLRVLTYIRHFVRRFVLGISKSRSSIKVIGLRSRSWE